MKCEPGTEQGLQACLSSFLLFLQNIAYQGAGPVHGHDRERLVQTIRPVLYALRQRQALMAAQSNAASTPYTGSIRIPGGGHIGNKPLLAIERLIEQDP